MLAGPQARAARATRSGAAHEHPRAASRPALTTHGAQVSPATLHREADGQTRLESVPAGVGGETSEGGSCAGSRARACARVRWQERCVLEMDGWGIDEGGRGDVEGWCTVAKDKLWRSQEGVGMSRCRRRVGVGCEERPWRSGAGVPRWAVVLAEVGLVGFRRRKAKETWKGRRW
jgi:hypothetical protein